MESLVQKHYLAQDLIAEIKKGLSKSGKDIREIQPKDLAPVDQLHTCGARATAALLKKARIPEGSRVLDAGCGLGGSSRLMAHDFGCRVTGLDLSPSFIMVARTLTRYTGLEDLALFHAGSVTALPFRDESFDAVLCQHILVNIRDKKKGLEEFSRVLKPGGQLILHEVTKGKDIPLVLPVPWADTGEISFLEPWETCQALIKGAGLRPGYFRDDTQAGLAWWERIRKAFAKNPGLSFPLGVHLVFGKNASLFRDTMFENFKSGAANLVEAVFSKPGKRDGV